MNHHLIKDVDESKEYFLENKEQGKGIRKSWNFL